MRFLKSKTLLTTLLLCSSLLASDDEQILSNDRLKLFDLSKEQVQEDAAKLQKDWINPITYKLSRTYNEETNPLRSTITVNQPIFKSGGIYEAIQYANSVEKYSNLDIDLQKKAMIKDATALLFEIHKMNYTIQKQELLVANANLDVMRRREQVMSGLLDASYLDNAILDANTAKNTLIDLQYQNKELINNFNNLASQPYQKFSLPVFDVVKDEEFLNNNLNIQLSKEDIEQKDHLSFMTISQYLPTINFTYDYNKYHDRDGDLTLKEQDETIGLNVTLPLDVRFLNDIQSARIDYLKSRITHNTTILEETNYYKTQMAKIEMIEAKDEIAKEDYKLYDSLLNDITQAVKAGLNAQADLDTLQNSKQIKAYDIEILKIERQIELLDIYARINR